MTLVEFLESKNVPVQMPPHRHVTMGRVGVDCPRCSPGSGKFKLGVKEDMRSASCWTCGFIPAVEAVAEVTESTWQEVRKELGGIEAEEPKARPRGKLVYPFQPGPLLPPHVKYLKRRGFDPDELVRLWGIGGIGISPSHPWRIFIPVRNVAGKTVSWTTRTIWQDAQPRYLSARPEEEEEDHKSLLYGEEWAGHGVVVCEGPTDVWRIGVGAVATLGVIVTPAQVRKIAKYPVRAICMDSDKDAQKRAADLCRQLQPFDGSTFNCVLKSKDAGEATEKELKELRRFLK